jgi:hypothetical protein
MMKINRDENHIYRDDNGKIYLSVTQHLQIAGLIDFSMVTPQALDIASERGTYVHDAVNLWLDDDLDMDSIDNSYLRYVNGAISFLENSDFESWESNLMVWSERLRTAGETDLLGEMRKSPAILDWKTGVKSPTTPLQLSAYSFLYNESNPNNKKHFKLLEINLTSDGKYRIADHTNNYRQYIGIFQSICKMNWWALSNGVVPVGAKNDPNIYELCKTIINGG